MASEVEIKEVCNFNLDSNRLTLDFKRCILCKEVDSKKVVVSHPKATSYEKIITRSKSWKDQIDGKFK